MSTKKKITYTIVLTIVCVILSGIVGILSVFYGTREIDFSSILKALLDMSSTELEVLIIKERISRTLFSMLAGASLSVSGILMQSITRNPIADPSVLGVNTGAALFVVIGIAFLGISSANEFIIFGLIGAGITALFVYGAGSIGKGGLTPVKLALTGVATSAALSSLVTAIILPRGELMDIYRFWQVGSVGGVTTDNLLLVVPFLIITMVISIACSSSFNALAMGDDMAIALGVNVKFLRIIAAVCGVMLCGVITALAGPISFIGIMAPHITRLIVGLDYKYLFPVSAVLGSCLLTLSDIVGRVLGRPGEIEVGIITAFIGAPILLFIATRSKGASI